MKSIYSYTEFRAYVLDYYCERKAKFGFTYARFASLAELKSPNYLKLVVDGKRNLTPASILPLARAMDLAFEETKYFEALVVCGQAKTESERRFHRLKLSEMARGRARRAANLPYPRVAEAWYSLPLLVALGGQSVQVKNERLAARIGIRPEAVANARDQFLRDGLVEVVNNKYRLAHRHAVYHDARRGNAAQRAYLGAQLDQSLEAFRTRYDHGAKFSANTFTLPRENFDAYFSKIQAFANSLIERADRDFSENLVQMNIQFFSLG